MRIFNTLSISNKIAAVFVFLLLMMGVGGMVGLYNAGQLANVTERIYPQSFKKGETLSLLENEFLTVRKELFLLAVTTDPAARSFLEGSLAEHKDRMKGYLAEYRSMGLPPSQEGLHAELSERLEKFWAAEAEVVTLAKEGSRDRALEAVRAEATGSFSSAMESLKSLINEERGTAFTDYQRSDFFANIIIIVTLGFTIMAIVAAGGLWLALTRSIVRPILAIEESARRMGQGDLDQSVPVVTDDEIGNLAVEFNKMAESLRGYYATLEKKVEERTNELKAANEELFAKKQELESTNAELREANRMKSQFLSNVSHELRTPLNSIIGFSELLQEKAFGELNEKQMQYVEFINSSGAHLLQLINNILDLSRIEAGRSQLNCEEFSVTEVLGEVLGSIRPQAHTRGIAIDSKTVAASPKLKADKAKFKQIMMNILSNAVKFNVEGGRVEVDWQVVEEPKGMDMERSLVFEVTDTGIGISDEDRDKLFKEFEQIDSSITREYGGAGLGLVLAKRLVEMHGGKIWFESTPGEGTTFFVKLPQGTEAMDMPVITSEVVSPVDTEARRPVLIASESPDINHLLKIYLAEGCYDIHTASDGLDLLRKAREQKPFAIIMGVTLPKKDGWEALKELKSNDDTTDIPVIIISSIDNRDLGLSLGAVEYMEKPIDRGRLVRVLEKLKTPAS